jgi:hypothetical protein
MKRCALFFLILIASYQVRAQRFDAGVFLGLSATQVSGDQLSGYNKTGFVGGGIVSLPLGKNFDLAMEIMYIQKGSRKKADYDKGDDTIYLLKLNYIEVPLMLSYTYKKRIRAEAGPSFGKLLFSSEEDKYGEIPGRPPFKDFELSINGGLSYRLIKGLWVHSRIATSVIPIRPHESGETYYFNKGQYNTVLFFSVRYIFSTGRKTESQ